MIKFTKINPVEDFIGKTIIVKDTGFFYLFPRYYDGECFDINITPGIYAVTSHKDFVYMLKNLGIGKPELLQRQTFKYYYHFN